jgi:hypothetical protein
MVVIVVVIVGSSVGLPIFVIPGLPKAEPGIGVVLHGSLKPIPGSVLRTAPE